MNDSDDLTEGESNLRMQQSMADWEILRERNLPPEQRAYVWTIPTDYQQPKE